MSNTTAEVIAIGDELTSGQRLDTNSRWLAQRLTEHGVHTPFHTTVADDLEANADVFRTAAARADLVVVTGGLGPTADDLTREALAAAAGVGLVEHRESLKHIKALYRVRGMEMPPQNARQALLPEGAEPIENPCGTAPGIDFTLSSEGGRTCRFFVMPGVPAEMKPMWNDTISARVAEMSGGRVTVHHLVKCFGVGESRLEAMLPDLIARRREPLVGITASQATLTLRVTTSGVDRADCERAMAPTLETIRSTLGDLVFAESIGAEEEPDLQHALVRLLTERGESLATVEGMSGGLLAESLARVDDDGKVLLSSEYGVSQHAGDKEADRVTRLAQQARLRHGVHWAIAVGAMPPAEESPLLVALASASGTTVKEHPLYGHRQIHRSLAAKHAMNLLRLELVGNRGEVRA